MKHNLAWLCRLLPLLAWFAAPSAHAQVGVGTPTPDAKSALDIRATDKGLLIPRLTAAQRTGIVSPPQGLMVYQTDGTAAGGTQTGFWYYAGTGGWVFLDAGGGSGLTLPYSGTASTSSSVFQITNSGGGIGVRGASASGQGVVGRVNGTGLGQGVVGVKGTTVPNVEDAGVVGLSEADYGVYARSSQSSGIYGISDGTAAGLAGLVGSSTASNGVGVLGTAPGTGVRGAGSTGAGLDGTSGANANTTGGVVGRNTSGANGVGVLGLTTNGYGVRGVASASGGYGVQGVGTDSYGVIGQSTSGVGAYGNSTSSYGVQGNSGTSSGVYGNSGASALAEAGVKGTNTSGNGVLGQATTGHGVRGEATGSGNGVYGQASGTGRAAYFTQTNSNSPAYAVEINQTGSAAALNVTGGAVRTPAVYTPYTGAHNMVAVAYGSIDYNYQSRVVRVYNSSDNFTVTVDRNNSGEFLFNFTPGSLGGNTNYGLTVVANVADGSTPGFVCQTSNLTANADLALTTYKISPSTVGNPAPLIFADWMRFSFVVYSQ